MGIHPSALNTLSSIDLSSLQSDSLPIDNEELSDQITLLAGQINAANYRFLKLIAEFDRREAWGGFGIRSCAHWLNWKCGISMGPAREKIRVARCLDSLPNINKAFSSGEISYSKVRAMTRVATDENEEYLLMIAQHGTAQHMEQLVRKYQKVEKVGDEQVPQVVCYQDDNGMWIIHAGLPAEAGALVVKAIDAVMEQLQEENVSAETSFEVERIEEIAAEPEKTFPPSLSQRRADALEALAEHYIATSTSNTEGENGLKPLAGSERYQVMLHVDINTLMAHDCRSHSGHHCEEGQHNHCNLDDKHWISPQTAKRLCCDASLVTVLDDENGNSLNIGRRSRIIPPAIKRALSIRDSGCRFPGCCETRYVDAHHIQHWADGGETKLDNLVTLCRHHHRELHKGSFDVAMIDSELVFTTVTGDRIDTSFTPQFSADVSAETNERFLQRHWPLVGSHTPISHWAGERMDIDMAVDGLMQ